MHGSTVQHIKAQKQMLFWSTLSVMILGVGVALSLISPPSPEEAQVHSPKYASLVKKRERSGERFPSGNLENSSAGLLGNSPSESKLRLVSRLDESENLVITPTASKAEKIPPTKAAALRPVIPPPDDSADLARPRGPASRTRPSYISESLDNQNNLQAIELPLACRPSNKARGTAPEQIYKLPENASQVRISGVPCELSEIASSEIVNLTNHSSATVFFPKPGHFTTDYLTISPGPNRIHVVHLDSEGEKEEHDYVILRAAH